MYSWMKGLVRNLAISKWADGVKGDIAINPRGELLTAYGLPERVELVRQGLSFGGAIPTGSAFTFVNAWPTTRAELILYNANPIGGKSLIIDRVWMTNITSQAAAQPFSILGQIRGADSGVAAAADDATVLRYALNGRVQSVYIGGARYALANTAFMLTNKWFIMGNAAISPMTTNLGNSLSVECYGRYIIPPGACFGIAGLAGTAAGTAIAGIEHHEVQMDVG